MGQKPSVAKGTRDFFPAIVAKRQYIFQTIKDSFETYGFSPIETPSFELSSTLMGKYGEEGDRLIFRILNSGEKMKKADVDALNEGNLPRFANSLSEKALRYDLTVPFARFVVQHQNDLAFPFKRYQIQPVWRADKPQKSRYQEFYQCDADVVGSDSLVYEVDYVQLFDEVLTNLNVPQAVIKINNRKILSGIAEVSGEAEKIVAITVAIDKLDKIGLEGVLKELQSKGISEDALEKIKPLFKITGDTRQRLVQMKTFLADSEIGLKGIEELEYIFNTTDQLGLKSTEVEFDVTLARGLNYYTGAIFEVKCNAVSIGSICGGGRYDDLTGIFGMKNMSGVGISFGADRIYDVLEELDLFPSSVDNRLELLFINFGEEEAAYCMGMVKKMREAGVSSELYPKSAKMNKQMKYANDRGVKFVALVGKNEMEQGVLRIKNMDTGEQDDIQPDALVNHLKKA
ncbi:MAG: histidine--tRNA ligase [Fluviicola sp. XM-24bin1]|nr:MAG: histidine--tRNA ligase [Fluviicola sp. XM-24bin1]